MSKMPNYVQMMPRRVLCCLLAAAVGGMHVFPPAVLAQQSIDALRAPASRDGDAARVILRELTGDDSSGFVQPERALVRVELEWDSPEDEELRRTIESAIGKEGFLRGASAAVFHETPTHYYLLSASHVTNPFATPRRLFAPRVVLTLPGGSTVAGEVIADSYRWMPDVAVLRLTKADIPEDVVLQVLPLGDEALLEQAKDGRVQVYGFPLGETQWQVAEGRIIGPGETRSMFGVSESQLTVSVDVPGGFSGGPLIYEGHLIGVIGGFSSAYTTTVISVQSIRELLDSVRRGTAAGIDILVDEADLNALDDALTGALTLEPVLQGLMWERVLSQEDWDRLVSRITALSQAEVVYPDGRVVSLADDLKARLRRMPDIDRLDLRDVQIEVIGSFLYSTSPNDVDIKILFRNSAIMDIELYGAQSDERITLQLPDLPELGTIEPEIWVVGDRSTRHGQRMRPISNATGGIVLYGDIGLLAPSQLDRYRSVERLLSWAHVRAGTQPRKGLSHLIHVVWDLVDERIDGARALAESLRALQDRAIVDTEFVSELEQHFEQSKILLSRIATHLNDEDQAVLERTYYLSEVQRYLNEAAHELVVTDRQPDVRNVAWMLAQAASLLYSMDGTPERLEQARTIHRELSAEGARAEFSADDVSSHLAELQRRVVIAGLPPTSGPGTSPPPTDMPEDSQGVGAGGPEEWFDEEPPSITAEAALFARMAALEPVPTFTDTEEAEALSWLRAFRARYLNMNYSLSYLMQVLWTGDKIPAEQRQTWQFTAAAADYYEAHPILHDLSRFTDVQAALTWLKAQRTEFTDPKGASNSLSYLMLVLWTGDKIPAEQQLQAWQFAAGAADYALKRETVIRAELVRTWQRLDAAGRQRLFAKPTGLVSAIDHTVLIRLKDLAPSVAEPQPVSARYARTILRYAWAFYGETLWEDLERGRTPAEVLGAADLEPQDEANDSSASGPGTFPSPTDMPEDSQGVGAGGPVGWEGQLASEQGGLSRIGPPYQIEESYTVEGNRITGTVLVGERSYTLTIDETFDEDIESLEYRYLLREGDLVVAVAIAENQDGQPRLISFTRMALEPEHDDIAYVLKNLQLQDLHQRLGLDLDRLESSGVMGLPRSTPAAVVLVEKFGIELTPESREDLFYRIEYADRVRVWHVAVSDDQWHVAKEPREPYLAIGDAFNHDKVFLKGPDGRSITDLAPYEALEELAQRDRSALVNELSNLLDSDQVFVGGPQLDYGLQPEQANRLRSYLEQLPDLPWVDVPGWSMEFDEDPPSMVGASDEELRQPGVPLLTPEFIGSMWERVLPPEDWERMTQRMEAIAQAEVVFPDGHSISLAEHFQSRLQEVLGIERLDPERIEIKVIGSALYSARPHDVDFRVILKDSEQSDLLLSGWSVPDSLVLRLPGAPDMRRLAPDARVVGDQTTRHDDRMGRIFSTIGGVRIFGNIGLPAPSRVERYQAADRLLHWAQTVQGAEPEKALSYLTRVVWTLVDIGLEGSRERITRLRSLQAQVEDRVLAPEDLPRFLDVEFDGAIRSLVEWSVGFNEAELETIAPAVYVEEIRRYLDEAEDALGTPSSATDRFSPAWLLAQAAALMYPLEGTETSLEMARDIWRYLAEKEREGEEPGLDVVASLAELRERLQWIEGRFHVPHEPLGPSYHFGSFHRDGDQIYAEVILRDRSYLLTVQRTGDISKVDEYHIREGETDLAFVQTGVDIQGAPMLMSWEKYSTDDVHDGIAQVVMNIALSAFIRQTYHELIELRGLVSRPPVIEAMTRSRAMQVMMQDYADPVVVFALGQYGYAMQPAEQAAALNAIRAGVSGGQLEIRYVQDSGAIISDPSDALPEAPKAPYLYVGPDSSYKVFLIERDGRSTANVDAYTRLISLSPDALISELERLLEEGEAVLGGSAVNYRITSRDAGRLINLANTLPMPPWLEPVESDIPRHVQQLPVLEMIEGTDDDLGRGARRQQDGTDAIERVLLPLLADLTGRNQELLEADLAPLKAQPLTYGNWLRDVYAVREALENPSTRAVAIASLSDENPLKAMLSRSGEESNVLPELIVARLRRPFKLVIADINNTLIPASPRGPEGRPVLEPATRDLLSQMVSRGTRLAVVSGSQLPSALHRFSNQFEPKDLAGQFLFINGGAVGYTFDREGLLIEEPVMLIPLFRDPDVVQRAASIFEDAVVEVVPLSPDGSREGLPIRFKETDGQVMALAITGLDQPEQQHLREQITAIIRARLAEDQAFIGAQAFATSVSVDINRGTKGHAVLHLLNTTGIDPRDVLIIGDSGSDGPMFDQGGEATKLYVGETPLPGMAPDIIHLPIRGPPGSRAALRLVLEALEVEPSSGPGTYPPPTDMPEKPQEPGAGGPASIEPAEDGEVVEPMTVEQAGVIVERVRDTLLSLDLASRVRLADGRSLWISRLDAGGRLRAKIGDRIYRVDMTSGDVQLAGGGVVPETEFSAIRESDGRLTLTVGGATVDIDPADPLNISGSERLKFSDESSTRDHRQIKFSLRLELDGQPLRTAQSRAVYAGMEWDADIRNFRFNIMDTYFNAISLPDGSEANLTQLGFLTQLNQVIVAETPPTVPLYGYIIEEETIRMLAERLQQMLATDEWKDALVAQGDRSDTAYLMGWSFALQRLGPIRFAQFKEELEAVLPETPFGRSFLNAGYTKLTLHPSAGIGMLATREVLDASSDLGPGTNPPPTDMPEKPQGPGAGGPPGFEPMEEPQDTQTVQDNSGTTEQESGVGFSDAEVLKEHKNLHSYLVPQRYGLRDVMVTTTLMTVLLAGMIFLYTVVHEVGHLLAHHALYSNATGWTIKMNMIPSDLKVTGFAELGYTGGTEVLSPIGNLLGESGAITALVLAGDFMAIGLIIPIAMLAIARMARGYVALLFLALPVVISFFPFVYSLDSSLQSDYKLAAESLSLHWSVLTAAAYAVPVLIWGVAARRWIRRQFEHEITGDPKKR